MNIFQFLRMFQRHLFLLIAVPLVLAVIVKYLTSNPALKYNSSATIFTGIASGYDLDQDKKFSLFANNTAFDNLIELIKSKDVATEVSLRLLTQNLMLNNYDPNYISRKNFIRLQKNTPANIKALIVKDSISSPIINHESEEKANIENNRADSLLEAKGALLENGKFFYIIKNQESIVDVSLRFGIPISELMSNNNLLDYSIATGTKLFLTYVHNQYAPNSKGGDFHGKDTINASYAEINPEHFEESLNRIRAYTLANDTNWIYRMINSGNNLYGVSKIADVTVKRIKSSDLLTLSFTSSDPGFAYQTLIHIMEVFIMKQKNINENQSDAVVKYFQGEVDRAARRLKEAEDRLLYFNKSNNIINYYEQSKVIAVTKESLDIKYQEEQIKFQSARAVIDAIESQLELQDRIHLKTIDIIRNRNALSEVTSKIAIADLYGDTDPKNIENLEKLKKEAEKLKKNLSLYIEQYFRFTESKDGLQTQNLLARWLDNVILYEQSKASLKVLNNRIREFQEYYKTFAPLGATQKRIEREIDVSEREYLSLLASLNTSKLKQQNIELSSNIKAVDPPYFPLKPIPVKTGILVIVAAFMGFAVVAFVIIALEYLDNTLKTPERFEDKTNLKAISAYPKIVPKYRSYNLAFIAGRLAEIAVQEIKSEAAKEGANKPFVVCFFSSTRHEGKTELAERMAERLRLFGEKVLILKRAKPNIFAEIMEGTDPDLLKSGEKERRFEDSQKARNQIIDKIPIINNYFAQFLNAPVIKPYKLHVDDIYYEQNNNLFDTKDINGLTLSQETDFTQYEYIFLELPPVILETYPVKIVKQADYYILVARANRVWKKADIAALKSFIKNCNGKNRPVGMLNGVEVELLESILGELPRKRSWIRRKFKSILSLQYKARYEIK